MASVPDDTDARLWGASCSYLYVIVIAENRIKVGQSIAPARRLMQHRQLAEAHGGRHGRQWVSGPCSDIDRLEDALIDFCALRAVNRSGREYFEGVNFTTAVDHARGITGGPGRIGSRPRSTASASTDAMAAFERVVHGRARGTVAQAAVWLGVSECQIQEMITAGDLRLIAGDRQGHIPVMAMRAWLRRASAS